MLRAFRYGRFLAVTVAMTGFAVAVLAQSPPQLALDSLPVGLTPLGVDYNAGFALVANSGDNSVSVVRISGGNGPKTIRTEATIQGIPAPYAVASCRGATPSMLVTSPSDNSITVFPLGLEANQRTIKVGTQPYSAACYGSGTAGKLGTAVVSNGGDNSLSVVDLDSAVVSTIPNVPVARGLHGITIYANGGPLTAWVAGTDANVVTLVDIQNARVLGSVPVRGPTAVGLSPTGGQIHEIYVASGIDNSVTFFNAETLQTGGPTTGIPNPQDFVISPLGEFAVVGGRDAVWKDGALLPIPGATALSAGTFSLNFTLRADAFVFVTSKTSNSVYLIQQQPTTNPRDFTVSNAASFGTAQVAPSTLVSSFTSTGASQTFFATSFPLPMTLGGVTLRVGGTLSFSATSGWTYSPTGSLQAGLLAVNSTQVNFQIPPGIAPGSAVPAQLMRPDGTSLLTTLNITPTAPGIFSLLQNGQGQGAVLNPDYSLSGNPQSLVGAKPAQRGSYIQIFATGGGDTTPLLLPGEAASATGNPLVTTNLQPTVTIGGQTAQVLFSGIAPGYAGLWQINAIVPQTVTPGNTVSLSVTSGGVASNTVTIAVQ